MLNLIVCQLHSFHFIYIDTNFFSLFCFQQFHIFSHHLLLLESSLTCEYNKFVSYWIKRLLFAAHWNILSDSISKAVNKRHGFGFYSTGNSDNSAKFERIFIHANTRMQMIDDSLCLCMGIVSPFHFGIYFSLSPCLSLSCSCFSCLHRFIFICSSSLSPWLIANYVFRLLKKHFVIYL